MADTLSYGHVKLLQHIYNLYYFLTIINGLVTNKNHVIIQGLFIVHLVLPHLKKSVEFNNYGIQMYFTFELFSIVFSAENIRQVTTFNIQSLITCKGLVDWYETIFISLLNILIIHT